MLLCVWYLILLLLEEHPAFQMDLVFSCADTFSYSHRVEISRSLLINVQNSAGVKIGLSVEEQGRALQI